MEGGLIQNVTNVPVDTVIEVYDYDVDDRNHPNVTKDEEGTPVFVNFWYRGDSE